LPVAETFAPALLQPEVCCAQDEEGAEGAEKAVKKVRAVAQGAAEAVMYSDRHCSPNRYAALQAAAAVSVGVGSFCDPDDVQARCLPQVTL